MAAARQIFDQQQSVGLRTFADHCGHGNPGRSRDPHAEWLTLRIGGGWVDDPQYGPAGAAVCQSTTDQPRGAAVAQTVDGQALGITDELLGDPATVLGIESRHSHQRRGRQ